MPAQTTSTVPGCAPSQALEQARRYAAEARAALRQASAAGLDACRERLERAAEHLSRAVEGLRRGGAAEMTAVAALQREIAATGSLMKDAAALMAGWGDRLGALAGGYTAEGRPGAWQARQRVAVEG